MTLYEKVSAASAEYFRRLASENLSEKTISNYRTVMKLFCEFLRCSEQPDEFVAVAEWKTTMFASGLSPSTIKQYLTTVEIFFSAASHRSYPAEIRFGENPVDKTLLPKIPERPYPTILTDEQVMQLYQNKPPKNANKALWPRNYAMMMLLVNEKIRNAELLDLRLSDVDMHNHILTIQSGKGRKWREVDLTELTEQALVAYLESGIRPASLSESDYLFGTEAAHAQGKPNARCVEAWHRGTRGWLSGVIERTVKAITDEKNVRSHDLRKVGSRICLNAGQSMEELQGQLGHSQISTTQIYTSRMGSKRSRDSARAVLAARDAAAEQMKKQNIREQNVIAFPA